MRRRGKALVVELGGKDEREPHPPPVVMRKTTRISYADRVRIRTLAEEAERVHARRNGLRYPKGFVANLARQYRVSDQAIYNILKN